MEESIGGAIFYHPISWKIVSRLIFSGKVLPIDYLITRAAQLRNSSIRRIDKAI